MKCLGKGLGLIDVTSPTIDVTPKLIRHISGLSGFTWDIMLITPGSRNDR